MCKRNATFIVFALFLMLFCDTISSECKQLAPCICSLPDGHYYNLTGLAAEKPFQAYNPKINLAVLFHPCTNVKMKNNTCANGNGVSLCLYNSTSNIAQNIGTIEETRMKLESYGKNKFPIFEIHHENVTSVITIVCNIYDNVTSFVIEPLSLASGSNKYYFKLISPNGCKIKPYTGLSTGSTLVILFFTIVGIYLIGGIVALKTLRGATGWEMVPNHDFWLKFPSLVRDGIVFTFNCCRADSYERI